MKPPPLTGLSGEVLGGVITKDPRPPRNPSGLVTSRYVKDCQVPHVPNAPSVFGGKASWSVFFPHVNYQAFHSRSMLYNLTIVCLNGTLANFTHVTMGDLFTHQLDVSERSD